MIDTKKFRTIQTTVSIVIFIAVLALCWFTTGFDISSIQLSYFGVTEGIMYLWNIGLVLISVSIFYNAKIFLRDHKRAVGTKFFSWAFMFASVCLALTGIIDMSHDVHDVTAYLYFFAYPLIIFAFAHYNRKHLQYAEWKMHTIVSILMVVCPLVILPMFKGMAIVEIIHTVFVMYWNIKILDT